MEFSMKWKMLMTILPILSVTASAEVVTKEVDYTLGAMTFKGFLAYDNAIKGKLPGVLVVHEWWGLNDFTKTQAKDLAKLGYAAFAVDMYGDGKKTVDPKIAAKMAGEVRGTPLMRERVKAGLAKFVSMEMVDPNRVAAQGFCFGGSAVLELAYSGADIKGAVTFHGGLFSPKPEDISNIKTKVLVLHGANDPTMSQEIITQFQESMKKSGIDWQMVFFSNTVHAFTNPNSGNDPSKGMAYNPVSAQRAFSYMKMFLKEVL
jgi:dienelactone hydrolase